MDKKEIGINLDSIIKSELYKKSKLGGQILFDKAVKEIEYLKSLKPTIPSEVVEFYEGLKAQGIADPIEIMGWWAMGLVPPSFSKWLESLDNKIITLSNMAQFGYKVEEEGN